ncbi:hypothetical protein [Absidia glauca]|uniref:MYND-type domain-containing protein n=1 Tax=Absidia glauca TaxID=4829 RepID=A0A168MCM3_ABSGL|nr:hypothetical protein [Absidia glauca]
MASSSELQDYLSVYGLDLQTTTDTTKGRAVLSTDYHKRGTVLVTSQPLGAVALPSTRPEVCNYCFRKPSNPESLQRCSQCKSAYFCDVACFKNAWLTYHQYVCRPASSNHQFLGDDSDQDALDLEMLERVALNCWRYNNRKTNQQQDAKVEEGTDDTKQYNVDEEGVDVTMEAFDGLMGHDQKQPKHTLQRYRRLAEQALSQPYLANSGLKVEQLVQYLCRFQCNNFGIHDDRLFTIGEGTYPVASLFNHSCRPNAVVMFEGALLSIVAIEPISPDQEVTIAYVDAAHDRSHRKSTLSSKYFFDCLCVRCVDTDIYGQIDTLLGKEASDWDRAQALLQQTRLDDDSDTPTTLRDRILQQVNDWDLLEMSRLYDRRHDGVPDASKPLNLAHYTHYVIQFFAPYLWSSCNLGLSFGNEQSASSVLSTTAPSSRPGSPPPLPSPPPRALSYFDDPLPQAARPKVSTSYKGIFTHLLPIIQAYPLDDNVVPYRLTTLSASTQLLYDEMDLGHWRNAVKLGMYVLIQYCWIYPPYHPIVAQHLLLLAKCSWNSIIKSELLGDGKALEKAYERGVRRWILLAKETLATVVGKQGEQWREVIELEWIFLREQKLKE